MALNHRNNFRRNMWIGVFLNVGISPKMTKIDKQPNATARNIKNLKEVDRRIYMNLSLVLDMCYLAQNERIRWIAKEDGPELGDLALIFET